MFKFQKYEFPKLGYVKVPRFKIGAESEIRLNLKSGYSSDDLLKALINEKFLEKVKTNVISKDKKEDYKKRLQFEVAELSKLKFTDYILLVYGVISFCKENGIANGPGRGSAAGSLVLYTLGVTQVDPLKHDLLFERFVSAARTDIKEIDNDIYISSASLPDVDIDTQASKKHLINEYLNSCFNNQTCAICNFSTLQSKVLLKDVLKTYKRFNEDDAKLVSNLIETKFGKVDSISDSLNGRKDPSTGELEKNIEFSKWAAQYQDVIDICLGLEQLIKNKSVHASGILLCNDKLSEIIPLELSSDKKVVSCYDMGDSAKYGLKLDNLGLKNLDVIVEALNGVDKKISDIDINDNCLYDYLNNSDCYYGVFQAEEGLGKNTLRKIKPHKISDIAASVALGRPGSFKFIDQYCKFKNDGEKLEIEPRIADILEPTGGAIIYQEQLIKLAQVMAGYSPKDADGLRKIIGKKLRDKMPEHKDRFINGSVSNGYTKDLASKIWNTFEASADYSFNKCLSPDTSIDIGNGQSKLMFEIKIGDDILSYNPDTDMNEMVTVLDKIESERELYEVEMENGIIVKASLDHKFMAADKRMYPLSQIILENKEILCNI